MMRLAFFLISFISLTHAFPSSQVASVTDGSQLDPLRLHDNFVLTPIEDSFGIEDRDNTEYLATEPTGCLSSFDKRDYDLESEILAGKQRICKIKPPTGSAIEKRPSNPNQKPTHGAKNFLDRILNFGQKPLTKPECPWMKNTRPNGGESFQFEALCCEGHINERGEAANCYKWGHPKCSNLFWYCCLHLDDFSQPDEERRNGKGHTGIKCEVPVKFEQGSDRRLPEGRSGEGM